MPRVSLNKAQYRQQDFVKWLAGEMYEKKIRQKDIAEWLCVTQYAVSYKMKRSNFTLEDMLVIFQELGTEREKQIELLTI